MPIRSSRAVLVVSLLLAGVSASCGSDGIAERLPIETTLPADGPAETEPPSGEVPETAPPETAPPETAPPETAPPETAPPETAPEVDESDDGGGSNLPVIVAILLGVAALFVAAAALTRRRPPAATAIPDRRPQLISMARWVHDQFSLEVLGLPADDARQRWSTERNRLDQLAIDLRVQAAERDPEVWTNLSTTVSALAASLDTAVRMRSTPDVDDQLTREAVEIANRHRADLETSLLVAEQTI